jgi:putative nucleotidyltransferase with HDIG domain
MTLPILSTTPVPAPAAVARAFRRTFDRLRLVPESEPVSASFDADDFHLAAIRDWGQSIESKDSYTFGHCERVAQNAVAVARALGLDESEQTSIRMGAHLHDVGKVHVPSEILNKPGALTAAELEVIHMHPVWGDQLLSAARFPWDLKPMIRWHHERYDGTGYPDRLRGDEIPLSAQIVGIADTYDALTVRRPYRLAMTPAQAIAEVVRCRSAWSPTVFHAFLEALPDLSRSTQLH